MTKAGLNHAPARVFSPHERLLPLVSEFGSAEEEAAYLAWLHEEVAASLADPTPPIPHDQVMAELLEVIKQAGRDSSKC